MNPRFKRNSNPLSPRLTPPLLPRSTPPPRSKSVTSLQPSRTLTPSRPLRVSKSLPMHIRLAFKRDKRRRTSNFALPIYLSFSRHKKTSPRAHISRSFPFAFCWLRSRIQSEKKIRGAAKKKKTTTNLRLNPPRSASGETEKIIPNGSSEQAADNKTRNRDKSPTFFHFDAPPKSYPDQIILGVTRPKKFYMRPFSRPR